MLELQALLLAQAPPVDPTSGLGNTLAPWANLTAVGALIFFLGFILVRALPRVLEAQEKRDRLFTDALANVVDRAEAQAQLQREHDEKRTERLEKKLDDLTYANGRDRERSAR